MFKGYMISGVVEGERRSLKYFWEECCSPRMISGQRGTVVLHEIWYIYSQENQWNCCHQMSYFTAKMHQNRFRLGHCPRPCWGSLQHSPDPL